jgi:hypothetical protein
VIAKPRQFRKNLIEIFACPKSALILGGTGSGGFSTWTKELGKAGSPENEPPGGALNPRLFCLQERTTRPTAAEPPAQELGARRIKKNILLWLLASTTAERDKVIPFYNMRSSVSTAN